MRDGECNASHPMFFIIMVTLRELRADREFHIMLLATVLVSQSCLVHVMIGSEGFVFHGLPTSVFRTRSSCAALPAARKLS